MSLVLTNGSTGLFDYLGHLFKAQEQLNVASATTVPGYLATLIDDVLAGLPTNQNVVSNTSLVGAGEISWQSNSSSLSSPLQQLAQTLVIEMVNAANPLVSADLTTALNQLVVDMQGAGTLLAPTNSVKASVVGATPTAGASNAGNGALVLSNRRYDGRLNENFIPETMQVTCTNANPTAGATGQPSSTFIVKGLPAVTNRLSPSWPGGSGASTTLSASLPNGSLLTNGGFETQAGLAGLPDGWLAAVGVPGTHYQLTINEIQTVAISGTPTSGWYALKYSNAAGKTQTTGPIIYNATSDIVQTALRGLTGLELVTVVQSGSTPNFTHTITFTGVGGNVTQLTSINNTGQTITHATTTDGTAQVFTGGAAFEILGDGSTLQEIRQELNNLPAETPLAFNCWMTMGATASGGAIAFDLYDGSATINDDAGNANSFTINASSLTTSWTPHSGVFRLPKAVPPIVQFRIRVSTAITNAKNLFIDQASMVRMTAAYQDGPYMALFAGNTDFVLGDGFTVAVTNTMGKIQMWADRFWQMREKGLLLPSVTDSSENVPDSLVA